MYEPCIISGKRGVKSLFNQPDVPAAAAGTGEGGSHLRTQLWACASGLPSIWLYKLLLLCYDWQAPHRSHNSRHNAQVGSSVSEAQPPATWPFREIFADRNVLSGSLNLPLSFCKIIKHCNQANKTILIAFDVELEGYQSLVWGSCPIEFAKAGLTCAVNVEITWSRIFRTPQRSGKYSEVFVFILIEYNLS